MYPLCSKTRCLGEDAGPDCKQSLACPDDRQLESLSATGGQDKGFSEFLFSIWGCFLGERSGSRTPPLCLACFFFSRCPHCSSERPRKIRRQPGVHVLHRTLPASHGRKPTPCFLTQGKKIIRRRKESEKKEFLLVSTGLAVCCVQPGRLGTETPSPGVHCPWPPSRGNRKSSNCFGSSSSRASSVPRWRQSVENSLPFS